MYMNEIAKNGLILLSKTLIFVTFEPLGTFDCNFPALPFEYKAQEFS